MDNQNKHQDLAYDYEDLGMDRLDLRDKYGDAGHPEYTKDGYAVYLNGTQGIAFDYWRWVVEQIRKDDEAMPGNDEAGNPVPPPNAIETLDEFGHLVTSWHRTCMNQIEQMLRVPDNGEISITLADKDGVEHAVALQGEAHKAFIGATLTIKSIFEQLPFGAVSAEPETPAPAEPEAPAAANDAPAQ